MVLRIRSHGILPGVFNVLRVGGEVVGNVVRPTGKVYAKRLCMVLIEQQATLCDETVLRLVWKGPCAGNNHVAFKSKNGLADFVPYRK